MKSTKKQFKNLRGEQAIFLKEQIGNQKKILAEDIMIQPTFLHEDDDIENILGKLQMEDINCCIVVDQNKKFIGEVTDDILLKIIAHASIQEPLVKILDIGYKRSINYTHARDYVNKHKHTVNIHTSLFEIMKIIDKKGFQYIPVIDTDKTVIGLITPSSILRFLLNR